jgi:hypothetical protein
MKQIKILKFMMINLFILSIIICLNCVTAHPASNVDLNYDLDNQKLNVTISHNTNDKETHYIEKVEVYKNGVTIIREDYTSQPSSNTFTLSFDISAVDGDVLKVETECSISGITDDSMTVKIGENGTSTKNDDTSTPGFGLLIAVLGIIVFMVLKQKRK